MNNLISKENVLAALAKVQEPELNKDLVTLNMIQDLEIKGDSVTFSIILTTPACPLKSLIEKQARTAVQAIPGVKKINIKMDSNVPSDGRDRGLLKVPIRNVIAIASGKGGVGKSTVSANLSIALAKSGARVGLMDADIYGPNIPTMMGINQMPAPRDNKLIPAESFGVKIMSMGFLVKPGQPLIWRGPMLVSAIRQFISDVEWGELDYLIVDLPPGTGDVPLSLAQALPLSGVVIVTLPQSVSLEDASRGLEMFKTLNVPILGVVENMRGDIFGTGGGEDMAKIAQVPFLGAIPMESGVRVGGDTGKPVIISNPNSEAAKSLYMIAEQVAAKISLAALNQTTPVINIINTSDEGIISLMQPIIVGIRFQEIGKVYHFDASTIEGIQVGDRVIVDTARGRQLGEVTQLVKNSEHPHDGSLKQIERRATPRDLVLRQTWQHKELEALITCRERTAQLHLRDVKIITAEFNYDGSRLTFMYNSENEEKVELKSLRQDMGKRYPGSQIEMRQIGPRDVAKVLGGMGACGLEKRCCSKFLTEFSPISIKMAKEQGISLTPAEITGMCGRLRCCLYYEYENYLSARKELPKRGKRVLTPQGEGKVINVNPITMAILVELPEIGKREYLREEIEPWDELEALRRKSQEPCQTSDGECNCDNTNPDKK